MLDKEFKDRWIAALRSGEYTQGSGALLFQGNYCCLGVAAAICGVPDAELQTCNFLRYDPTNNSVLSKNHIGKVPMEIDDDMEHLLSSMNDSGDHSFMDIADYIQQNY